MNSSCFHLDVAGFEGEGERMGAWRSFMPSCWVRWAAHTTIVVYRIVYLVVNSPLSSDVKESKCKTPDLVTPAEWESPSHAAEKLIRRLCSDQESQKAFPSFSRRGERPKRQLEGFCTFVTLQIFHWRGAPSLSWPSFGKVHEAAWV